MHAKISHYYKQKGNPYEKIDHHKAERAMYANLTQCCC
jgi:hypothetical protein